MAARRQTGIAPSRPPRAGGVVRPMYEDFRPNSEWKQQELSQLLLVYLPGFGKEQIKVSTEGMNTLRVRGERLVGGNKWSRFQEEFPIPDECNIRGIRAKFEDGTLTITMPNKTGVLTKMDTEEAAKTTKNEAPPPPRDQLPPKTISSVSEDKRTDGKGITQELSSQKVATEPPKSPKVQAETPPKLAPSTDAANQSAEGKDSTVGSATAAKVVPETTEKKERSQEQGNLREIEMPESTASEKALQKDKEIGEKVKESLRAENLIEKTVKKEKEEIEGNANDHKGKTHDFADAPKETLATDDVTSGGGGDGADDEGFTLHKYKQAIKGLIAKGGILNEERQLIVNMGMAILVIVGVGAYISYTLGGSSG